MSTESGAEGRCAVFGGVEPRLKAPAYAEQRLGAWRRWAAAARGTESAGAARRISPTLDAEQYGDLSRSACDCVAVPLDGIDLERGSAARASLVRQVRRELGLERYAKATAASPEPACVGPGVSAHPRKRCSFPRHWPPGHFILRHSRESLDDSGNDSYYEFGTLEIGLQVGHERGRGLRVQCDGKFGVLICPCIPLRVKFLGPVWKGSHILVRFHLADGCTPHPCWVGQRGLEYASIYLIVAERSAAAARYVPDHILAI